MPPAWIFLVRTARRDGELPRGRAHGGFHDLARDPDEACLVVDDCTGRTERLPGARAHELDPDLLEELQRCLVDRLDLLLGQEADGPECVLERRGDEVGVIEPRRAAGRAICARATSPSAAVCGRRLRAVQVTDRSSVGHRRPHPR